MRKQHWTYNCDCCGKPVVEAHQLTPMTVITGKHAATSRQWDTEFDACRDCLIVINNALGKAKNLETGITLEKLPENFERQVGPGRDYKTTGSFDEEVPF